jgi:hypothetical protein
MSYLGRTGKLSQRAYNKLSFLATAGQTVKSGLSYVAGFVEVYVNGTLLTDVVDYSASNGNSVTFLVALSVDDEVTVVSLKTFVAANMLPLSGGTLNGDLSLKDNNKLLLGTSNDLQIYHDGGYSYIDEVGTGDLVIRASNNIWMQRADGTETLAKFTTDGACEFRHNNSQKLSTTSTGISVTGDVAVSGGVVFGDAGGSGTSSNNTLDEYEEGTWTPTGSGITLASAAGWYIKIGNLVTVTWACIGGSSTSGASTYVQGLPFAAAYGYTEGGSHGYVSGSANVSVAHITATSTALGYRTANGGAWLTYADFNGTTFRGTLTYTAA